MERNSVEIFWKVDGVREFVLEGFEDANLSRCIFYAAFLQKNISLILNWYGDQLKVYVDTYYDGGLGKETCSSNAWGACLLQNSGSKNLNSTMGLYEGLEIATKQELLEDSSVFREPLTMRIRVHPRSVEHPFPVPLFARSRCGYPNILSCTVNYISLLQEDHKNTYSLHKIKEVYEEVNLEIFLKGGDICADFACSKAISGHMLMEAVFLVHGNGEREACWKGKKVMEEIDAFVEDNESNTLILLGGRKLDQYRKTVFSDDAITLCFEFIDYMYGSICYAEKAFDADGVAALGPLTPNQSDSESMLCEASQTEGQGASTEDIPN